MMPQLVTVGYRRPGRRWLRVFVPVVPVLVLLSPVLLLAVPIGVIACRAAGVRPMGALRDVWRLLLALPGLRIEVDQAGTALLVDIR